ncbi:two-component system NtrC family sensor kinase [Sunxiuqinia elliptica]|uniref:histidine kinase n=2 Tax=Sunxiuqinia elliptica TaxID=655355 RepID=A0A4R6H8U4_9BACT|nr:two-component system NtrC family sensor kinase [Sunxiuqinia elliptica]TDO62308.1 two-component system NtrC family sensor kinase [Sunxiuqinia elliptica]
MPWLKKIEQKQRVGSPLVNGYVKFRSSIYGRVIFIIAISSFFLFVSFGIIFRSVNETYMKSVISENGNNISFLVEGALYDAMLKNDQASLQRTLDLINNMSGIDNVSMYDANNNLAYTSISAKSANHSDPDCISCHVDFSQMFSAEEKSYRIIEAKSECIMNPDNDSVRNLMIKSPILNAPSCHTAACHAHSADQKILGSLIIKMPLEKLDSALQESTTDFFLMATLITILFILFLILFTNKKIKNPLNEIIRAAEKVAKGDKNTRLRIKPNSLSDMRMVSYAFNEMLDNLHTANTELQNWSQQLEYKVQKKSEELGQAQNELINIERIASLGKLSLSVAHEINNPLSGILIYTKLIYKQLSNPALDQTKVNNMLKHLKLIESETKRCGDIVKGLLDFSKKDQEGFEAKHLHKILSDTATLMSHPMKIANIHFLTDLSAKHDQIFCSPNQIKQACMAILVNASEAVGENGEITLRTHNPNSDQVEIEIIDNGIGIAEADLPYVFEPFFSTKEKASGTGLGLSIVHGIIQSHKGKTEAKSQPGKGTTIAITLPLLKT